MTLTRFAVTKCGGYMDEEYQCSRKLGIRHYYLWLFLQVALSHIPPLGVLVVHINGIRGITIHITDPPKFISAVPKTMIRHHSSIFSICHPFQPLPILLLRIVVFRSVLVLMSLNYNKIVLMCHRLGVFGSQCQWIRIFISLTTPIAMGTQLCHSSSRKL